MKLGTRLALVLSTVVAVYALLDHSIQRWIVLPRFETLEKQEGERAVERAEQAVARELAHLAGVASALATRIQDAGSVDAPAWPSAAELGASDVQLFLCTEPNGQVLHARSVGPASDQPVVLRDFPSGALSSSHWIMSPLRPGAPVSGLWRSEHGPLLLASCSVDSTATGRRIVLGRYFDADLVERMSAETRMSVLLWPLESAALPQDERALVDRVTGTAQRVSRVTASNQLRCYTALSDARGQPAFLLAAELPRTISAHGEATARYALISTLAAGLLLVLVLLLLLRRIVISPLAELTRHAEEIGHSDDLARRLVVDRPDEIGSLSREFDSMVGKLAVSRAQVVETARSAGRSEIATGILHNVGNVLNSVNVSVDLIGQRLRDSKTQLLERLSGVVAEHEADFAQWVANDPQGRKLPPFLGTLTRQVVEERTALQEEVGSLAGGVQHIRALVDAQQAYATQAKLTESTALETEFERAVKLTENAPGGARDVAFRIECERGLCARTDRSHLLDILVNLVQNARQALGERCDTSPLIVLRAIPAADGIVRVEVEDNGVGIGPEVQAQLFRHGFTTRAHGHGFGLHASANAATQLGGRLSAHSDGPGKGARFTLELPGSQAVAQAA